MLVAKVYEPYILCKISSFEKGISPQPYIGLKVSEITKYCYVLK